jgi:hypothetical protein
VGAISTYSCQSIAPLSLGYDGEDEANVAYEGSQKPFSSYDNVAVQIAREKGTKAEATGTHFPEFLFGFGVWAKFAAKSGRAVT